MRKSLKNFSAQFQFVEMLLILWGCETHLSWYLIMVIRFAVKREFLKINSCFEDVEATRLISHLKNHVNLPKKSL